MTLMTIGNVLFWAVLIIGGLALTRYLTGRGRHAGSWPDAEQRPTPEQVLAQREYPDREGVNSPGPGRAGDQLAPSMSCICAISAC